MERNLKNSSKFRTKDLALMGVLVAAEVVLSRFLSLAVWNLKIGFAFIPMAIAAIMLGPIKAGIVCALSDFVGAILFPIGQYFPGFTLTAFLTGFIFGVFLYEKQNITRIAIAVLINQLILGLSLNTLWISILYGAPYKAVFISRIPQVAIMIPVQILITNLLSKSVLKDLLTRI